MKKVIKKEEGQAQLALPLDLANYVLRKPEQAQENKFFPYIFIASRKMEDHIAGVVYLSGGNVQEIPTPWSLVRIASRNSTRQLIAQKYTNRNFEGGETDAEYQEAMEEIETGSKIIFAGQTHLIFVISEIYEGFATVETYGASESYWGVALSAGDILKKKGCKILIGNHSENMTTSKAGNLYLSAYKFKQWESFDLDEEFLKILGRHVEENEARIQRFLSQ